MAKRMENNLFPVFQHVISNSDIKEKYDTGHKLFDFVPGDLVKCTLMKGFYKVKGFIGDKVTITNINNSRDNLKSYPEFLEKVDLDRRWVKVLYEEKE